LSPDGSKLYVAERFADKIGVIDTKTYQTLTKIDLGGPQRTTIARRGAQLFSNASHTFQNQYSCYTCHPDGHEDGLVYDLTGTGRDLANVQTLRDLPGTSPFKWNGKNVSVYMQCGMRFSTFVTRTEAFSPENLDALVAYIMRDLTHPPNPYQLADGELTPAQQRGKEIYERTSTNTGEVIPESNRCITCHPGPNFTDRKTSDVGTGVDGDRFLVFDSPNLNNIYESAPYLHDGSAASLEEIWTKFNDHDQHGVANDMTKDQLNDLIEYLKGMGPARTYTDPTILQSDF
jgi:YVTN family beta-propeller protein